MAPTTDPIPDHGDMPEGARRALRAARAETRDAYRRAARASEDLVELTARYEAAERMNAALALRATAAEDALRAHATATARPEVAS